VTALLAIDDLHVDFQLPSGMVRAVRGLSLVVEQGRSLGVVGESGCGKSASMLAVLGLLPPSARVSGSIRLAGRTLSATGPNDARGRDVAMVFQDSMHSLNPLLRIGTQVAEVIHYRHGRSWRSARAEALDHLERVGLPDPARVARQYPHQLSGGMRQRVMLAAAITGQPRLLIADEPTTGLDVTVQAQILGLLRRLRDEVGLTVVFVSHDLGAVAELCDDVAVVYGGRVVEQGPTRQVIDDPRHPYTQGLVGCYPRLGQRRQRLRAIAGSPPSGIAADDGCAFRPRCERAGDECARRVDLVAVEPGRAVACVRPGAEG
jgi:peptide/nickel transport system ATP-binding protein